VISVSSNDLLPFMVGQSHDSFTVIIVKDVTVQIACGESLGTYKTISPYQNFVRSENVIRGSKRVSQKKVRQESRLLPLRR
jgi:hypothetical protein